MPVLCPDWPAPQGVRAFMSTRRGGVSSGVYASMNVGMNSGDDADRVRENRQRLVQATGLREPPRWLRQVHGVVVVAAHEVPADRVPEADGAWTDAPGVGCVVMAADCLPVLLARRDGGAVAALHAGWRGLAEGVVEAGVNALPGAPEQYIAWLGARIGPDAFVVREDVRSAFQGADDAAAFASVGADQWRADLGRLAANRLRLLGIEAFDSGLCTASDNARFFSHRRDGACGRMAAVIWRETGREAAPVSTPA